MTASEEAHLRGEIAHAYFIFGVDDKAVRAARQAIAKDTEGQAFMGYWAGGLASWRAERFELAGSFFRTLAEMENAPDVLRAGAAFWAHRVAMRFGQPLQADSYMNIAATYPETFYGVMAVQAAGQRYEIDFSLPAITDDFRLGWPRKKVASVRWPCCRLATGQGLRVNCVILSRKCRLLLSMI